MSVLAIHLKILKCCLPLLIYFRSLASCSSPEFSNADMPAIRQLIRKEILQNYLTEQQSIVERHCEKFRRRFQNKDAATCWLNSSLQMILCAIDHSQGFRPQSNLGFKLELALTELITDSLQIKQLIQREVNKNNFRQQDIFTGYQDVRDLLCLILENRQCWPEVYSLIFHTIQQSITCLSCETQSIIKDGDVEQLCNPFICPESNTSLKTFLEYNINQGDIIADYRCEYCKEVGEARMLRSIKTEASSMYFIVALERGDRLNYTNKVDATEDVVLLDSNKQPQKYSPISVIHHEGGVDSGEDIYQHYMCDVLCKTDHEWYRTSDASEPRKLQKSEVTKAGYVILYRQKS